MQSILKAGKGKETKQIAHGPQNAYGFTYTGSYAKVLKASEKASGVVIEAAIYSRKVSKTATIYVGKQVTDKDGKPINTIAQQTFYAAIFDENGVRVTDIKPVTVNAHNSSSSSGAAKFEVPVDLAAGKSVYYIKEVKGADDDTPFSSSNVTTVYSGSGSDQGKVEKDGKIVLNVKSEKTFVYSLVKISNQYKVPNIDPNNPLFEGNGSFGIEVRVVDADGKPQDTKDLVASFKVAGVSGGSKLRLKNYKTVSVQNASSGRTTGIYFPVAGKTTDMTVTLMSIKNSQGASLAKDYTLLTASYDNQFSKAGSLTGERTFKLAVAKENQGPVVFVLRKNDSNEKASLTLTKSVIYKKTPIRVNATYYIGIFADAAHTKLLFKKAMTMLDASSMSDTLKVNINSQKDHKITLYFAETDRSGQVVESGKKTGYNITVEPSEVTLSHDNMEATVVVTNEILDGSKTHQKLVDPSSGFAGDAQALAEAQSLAESSNLGGDENKDSKTGDNTPVMIYLIIALISAAFILALGFTLRRRRRR